MFPIFLPPLRERIEDVPRLCEHFLNKWSRRNRQLVRGIEAAALEMLQRYSWPGNVRELENLVERVLVLSEGPVVGPEDLPDQLRRSEVNPGSIKEQVLGGRKSLGDAVDEFERDIIVEALQQTEFNQTRAAEMLGTTRRILKYRMDKLGIEGED